MFMCVLFLCLALSHPKFGMEPQIEDQEIVITCGAGYVCVCVRMKCLSS